MEPEQKPRENPGRANLRPPWKKGQPSANPGGRPKGSKSVTKIIRQMLDDGLDDEDIAEELAKTALRRAKSGDLGFWKEVIERTDGKVADKVEQDGAVKIVIEYADKKNDGSENQIAEGTPDTAPSD